MCKETKSKFTGYVGKIRKEIGLFNSGCTQLIYLNHVTSEDWTVRNISYTIRISNGKHVGNLAVDSKIEFEGLYSISKNGVVAIRYPYEIKKIY